MGLLNAMRPSLAGQSDQIYQFSESPIRMKGEKCHRSASIVGNGNELMAVINREVYRILSPGANLIQKPQLSIAWVDVEGADLALVSMYRIENALTGSESQKRWIDQIGNVLLMVPDASLSIYLVNIQTIATSITFLRRT